MIDVVLALLPVVAFLVLLHRLDSFDLVGPRTVTRALALGILAAGVCVLLNRQIVDLAGLDPRSYSRTFAPWVEEGAKALFVAAFVLRGRTGFLVDAAIVGFAVGTGFALVENAAYLWQIEGASHWLWGVRGFGTAVMHGGAAAITALVAQGWAIRSDRHARRGLLIGWVLAALLHTVFNQFLLPPVPTTAILLVTMPLLLLAAFDRSEKHTRQWLGADFDSEAQLLEALLGEGLPDSSVGRYLASLRERFEADKVVDLFCLLRLHLELSIRAKGRLLAREAGLDIPVDQNVRDQLEELAHLERSVGATARLALHPIRRLGVRDLWKLSLLGD